jgi:diguanylate cyclase (GGDEF)-like protein/PAS domain S-box-containing protein
MKLRQLTALLDDSPDATVAVDVHGRIAEWNPAAEVMFGWTRAGVLDLPFRSFVPGDELAVFDIAWSQLEAGIRVPNFDADRMHHDGTRLAVHVHVSAVRDDAGFAGAVGTFRPRVQPDLVILDGPHDEASGLPSRRLLQAALTAAIPAGMARGVAVIDVDAFALVNQTYGPDVGDDVLRELGRRLAATRAGCVAGRWQADEFVYVVDAPDPVAALDLLIEQARSNAGAPLSVGDQCLYLTVSAGLATTAQADPADLFAAATRALRLAKAGGRDRAAWCDPADGAPAHDELRLASDLRIGIAAGELRLLYQPILELANHDVIGLEALVRWQRPGSGLLGPAEFIDVAERTGQIVPLGAWVFEQACQTGVLLAQLDSAPHSMSINLSARQLSDPGVVDMLLHALIGSGCAPSTVIIEVTETALMHDMPTATATLRAIKALGVDLALDDFGTGYSSLLYLKDFPVDRIKIDRSFISGLGVDADATAIVASTISLAHSVGVQAVAEGVETVDQLTLLRQMGCDFAQGFLLSAPLTLDQLTPWLHAHPPARRRRAKATTTPLAPETGQILRMHKEGASLHTIAAALNVEGRRTALDLRWSPQSVAKVITRSEFPTIALPA